MERIPYKEAREWFWTRTAVWFVPAFVVTAIGCFVYTEDIVDTFKTRLILSLVTAFGATVLGLLTAAVSIQFPWMRLGRWRYWWLNAFVCAVVAAFCGVGLGAVILSVIRAEPLKLPPRYVFDTANSILVFGIAGAAFWGAAFGSWFALRFDKYFVESI